MFSRPLRGLSIRSALQFLCKYHQLWWEKSAGIFTRGYEEPFCVSFINVSISFISVPLQLYKLVVIRLSRRQNTPVICRIFFFFFLDTPVKCPYSGKCLKNNIFWHILFRAFVAYHKKWLLISQCWTLVLKTTQKWSEYNNPRHWDYKTVCLIQPVLIAPLYSPSYKLVPFVSQPHGSLQGLV